MASSSELPWEAAGVHGTAGIQLLISQAPSPLRVTAVVLTQPEQRQHFPGLQPLIEAAALRWFFRHSSKQPPAGTMLPVLVLGSNSCWCCVC